MAGNGVFRSTFVGIVVGPKAGVMTNWLWSFLNAGIQVNIIVRNISLAISLYKLARSHQCLLHHIRVSSLTLDICELFCERRQRWKLAIKKPLCNVEGCDKCGLIVSVFFVVVWILCCCLVSWLQVCCAHASLTHLSCKTPLLISSITLWWKGDHSNNWQALARLSDIKAEEIELACLLWQAMGQATYDYFLLLHGKALSISHVLHEWLYKPFWLVQILQRHAMSCSMKIPCLKCKTHQELANKRLALDVAALADLCHLPELLHRLQLPRWEGTHSVVPVPVLFLLILGPVWLTHHQFPSVR